MVKVPAKTSVYKIEPSSNPYAINFAPELVDLIKTGEKVKTYRFGKKYNYLEVGDLVEIVDNETREIVTKAKITSRSLTTFGSLPLDIQGHETYKNKEEQRKVFNGYYAFLGRPLKDDDPFLVFQFEPQK